jgi:predicted MFS family arabinose efflux permease
VLSADGRLIFAARALRSFAFGWLSIILALYLDRRGFSGGEIGALLSATMVEDALLTMLLSSMAARLGPARVMAAAAPLLSVGGLLLATADSHWALILGVVFGTVSPNGQDAGAFAPLEQALLPGSQRSGSSVRVFAWYNVFSFVPSAAGALAAGAWLGARLRGGAPEPAVHREMLLGYAVVGLALAALYVSLARFPKAGAPTAAPAVLGRLGLGRSRGYVLWLAGLQALDSLAGGFVIQTLLAYWFQRRFGASPEAIGALFFGTSVLSGVSFLVASRIAERFGLLNTMVFTHLPSNLLLMLVPFMPSFASAAAVLLARHLLSQMDVPTRQAYTVALVSPEERPAAAGLTVGVRSLAQACAPALAGLTLAAATPTPFLLAGGLKIVYDLGLFFRFRRVPIGS